eukprot:TRINITY_DN11384_c2_g1_i1.p2 TRINITY_DN11384_c2_g1~~TRINITY_DN11384_c2_g1_i1.p2  ORF type:complete len:122 (+),score=2.14 TRINITY_DN11384_c2_g1_i1:221-586(+)
MLSSIQIFPRNHQQASLLLLVIANNTIKQPSVIKNTPLKNAQILNSFFKEAFLQVQVSEVAAKKLLTNSKRRPHLFAVELKRWAFDLNSCSSLLKNKLIISKNNLQHLQQISYNILLVNLI